tara:strand:+ start:996 stop:2339 length:1344 start_codon:yes stop_codon:yes gene_type:complete
VATLTVEKGLSEDVIHTLSAHKNEPKWMLDMRLKAFNHFINQPTPKWGNTELLEAIDFEDICYFNVVGNNEDNWDNVSDEVKDTFEDIGIPEAEQKWLGGVTAQYDSESIYHSIRADLVAQGVIFMDMDTGLRKHPEIVKKYFGKVISYADNKFSALNTAFWSGGSFIYVPKGVKVEIPVQAYFFISSENMGQFERTLIIADEGSSIHYIEGCSAPAYTSQSLHSAVVELVAHKDAHIRYTTIQNWADNVYNLVTKRAIAHENACVEWVDGNIGSALTMKYPSVILKGEGSHAEIISVAYAKGKQHQDTGSKVIHMAANTTSNIVAKSISKDGGRSSYRGLIKISKKAHNSRSKIVCDAIMFDNGSQSDTYPTMEIENSSADIEHEASVSKVSGDQLFYLMSRGFTEPESMGLIVNGFFEPFTKELPMDYAVELNHLLEMEMKGSIG